MGGLSRKFVKIQEIRDNGVEPLIVDAGDLFFSTKNIDTKNKNSEMFRARSIINGYSKIGYDVINIGHYEVLNGLPFLKEIVKNSDIPFVSANLKDPNADTLIFNPYQIVTRGNLDIGVLGVTNLLPDTTKSMSADDYIQSCIKYSKELSEKVDIVVALVNATRSDQSKLAEQLPDVDFIVTSGSTNMSRPNSSQKEGGPFLYSCGKQGKYLLSLDVKINDASSPFVDVSAEEKKIKNINKRFERLQKKDPDKKLEEIYADQQNVLNLIRKYRDDIQASESLISSASNTIKFQTTPLNKKTGEDKELLSFVTSAVKTCNSLAPPQAKRSSKSGKRKKNPDPHAGHNH